MACGRAQVLELVFRLHCVERQHRHLGTAGLKSVQAPGKVHIATVSVYWQILLDYKDGCNRQLYPFLPAASLSFNRAFQSLSWVFVGALGAKKEKPKGYKDHQDDSDSTECYCILIR